MLTIIGDIVTHIWAAQGTVTQKGLNLLIPHGQTVWQWQQSSTKANYNILKAAGALSHFKANALEELNQMEAEFHT